MLVCWSLLLLLLGDVFTTLAWTGVEDCRFPLGMQDGSIPDISITASSQWYPSTAPWYARLETERGDGAWCSAGLLRQGVKEFLQVSLGSLHLVTALATQGRFAHGRGREFARQFRLNYTRNGQRWMPWRDHSDNQVIQGNNDAYTAVLKGLQPPVVARALRFLPFTERPTTVCMRVELFGCTWEDGLTSYSIPFGHVMPIAGETSLELNDFTYDGRVSNGNLVEGLGQLSDGEVGPDYPTQTKDVLHRPGYEYVGWNKNMLRLPFLEMQFVFQLPRNFTTMKVYCNHQPKLNIQVFEEARCVVRPTVGLPWDASLEIHHKVKVGRESGGQVIDVPLKSQWGRVVTCHLYFAAPWLLLSEVSFTNERSGRTKGLFPSDTMDQNPVDGKGTFGTESPLLVTVTSGVEPQPGGYVHVVVVVLVVIILLLLLIIAAILCRHHWKEVLQLLCREERGRGLDMRWVAGRAEGSTARLPSHDIAYETVPGQSSENGEPNACCTSGTAAANKAEVNAAHSKPGAIRGNPSPPLRRPPAAPPLGPPPPYATLDCTVIGNPPFDSIPAYAEAVIVSDTLSINTYAIPRFVAKHQSPVDLDLFELPLQKLRFCERLGEGQFGEVHLCETTELPEVSKERVNAEVSDSSPLIVAVKTLRADACKGDKKDFLQEVKILSCLHHPNIVCLLGVSLRDDPMCMVTEYMSNGDLHQFLQLHTISKEPTCNKLTCISVRSLLHVGRQIACGMAYLASVNLVHRDLATRNCLVGTDLSIKVADFGLSRQLYSADYYRIKGRAVLPIRWLAWESLLQGKFTTASDVWSYGVTLWEVLTSCKKQPYQELTDEEVVENASEVFMNRGKQRYLPRPAVCPPHIYNIMLQCWRRESQQRPEFSTIIQLLDEEAQS
uniref:discoidin domain-containing receptor 2-like n=1 Tax=Myxine glutinosa TaxID=7769 RepID=UPI00358F9335